MSKMSPQHAAQKRTRHQSTSGLRHPSGYQLPQGLSQLCGTADAPRLLLLFRMLNPGGVRMRMMIRVVQL